MTIIENKDFYEYNPDTLKKLQKLELMILKEFIHICDEHEIEYYLDGGTALGAVRHNGFIPWDDDIDVIMLRENYDKFIEVMESYKSDKYELLCSETKDYYCRNFAELNLKGTHTNRFYDSENTDFDIGVSIDIFVLDNMPKGFLKEKIFKLHYTLFRKLLLAYEVSFNDKYISKNKELIGRTIRKFFKILGIDNNYVKNKGKKLIEMCKKASDNTVCNLSTIYSFKTFPKSMFTPPKTRKFEDIYVNIPNDYDGYLKRIYGDYMKIPPVEERVNHMYNTVDFGEY